MKKLILVSTILLGLTAVSQAGVNVSIGFGFPTPPFVISRPAPVVVETCPPVICEPPRRVVVAPPVEVCAPPVVVVPGRVYGHYRPYAYYDRRWDHGHDYGHDRGGHWHR